MMAMETLLMIKMVIMMVIVIYNKGVMAMNGGMKSIKTRMMTKILTMMLIITGSMKNVMMMTKITRLTGMMLIISGSLWHQKYPNDGKDDTDDKDGDDNHWQSAALCLLSSLQLKNFPLNSWTPTTAKMNCNYHNHRSGEPKSHIFIVN